MMASSRRHLSLLISAMLVGALLAAVPATARAASTAASASPRCSPLVPFNAERFLKRPDIDNKWLPLAPGNNTVLSGTVRGDDGKLHPHTIVSTVTDLTKMIDGVRTLVVFERDIQDGQLQESELAFEAQDLAGRVWNLGEYPEEYEDGKLIGAPSTWIAGLQGAIPGIAMLADPRLHRQSYLQGRAPAVDFFDCGKVVKTQQRVCVPVRCFNDVLVVDEWDPLDPEGGHQLKYHAPHVGVIKVGATGGANPEVLSLVKIGKLSATAFAKIRSQVIAQDRRGYRVSKVYARTAPLRPLSQVDD